MKKKVIVTGSLGFVGLELANYLSNKYEVIGVDNLSTNTDCYYIKQIKNKKFNTQITKDIRELNIIDFEDVEIVFHLGAMARVQNSLNENSYNYLENNIVSTSHLVNICSLKNIKLVFISSSSVSSENELSPYSQSKLIGENIVSLYDNSITIRLFNIYGNSMPRYGENSTLIGRILYAIDKDEEIQLYGNGQKERDFTNVHEVVKAIDKISLSETYKNKIIELGTGRSYSILNVIKSSGVRFTIEKEKTHENEVTKAKIGTYNIYGLTMNSSVVSFLREYKEKKH